MVKPRRTFEVLARKRLDGPHLASAAFADFSTLLRTEAGVSRIGR